MEFVNVLEENAVLLWVIICILSLAVEGYTMGLTTIWFSIGALIALLSVFIGVDFIIQFLLFLVSSLILLLFTRKIFVNKLKTGKEKTNIEALIGIQTVLLKDITPYGVGSVKLNGQEWSAACKDRGTQLEAGTKVEVIAIDGVKAIVRQID